MSISSIVTNGRRLMETTFLDSCTIGDRSETRDARGGEKAIWTDRTDTVECRFVGLSDDLPVAVNGQAFGVPVAVWLAPLGTDVAEGDRVTNGTDGSKWIITSSLTPPSALAICIRMGIRDAEGGETN